MRPSMSPDGAMEDRILDGTHGRVMLRCYLLGASGASGEFL